MPAPAQGLDPAELTRRWFPGVAIEGVRRLEGGWMNDVFAIDSEAGPLVLRVLQPEATAEMISWSHHLLDRIAPRLSTVQPPLRTPGGATTVEVNDRLATLERFVEGRLGNRAGSDIEPAARALGALHAVLAEVDDVQPRSGYPRFADLDWRENRWWSWSRVDRELVAFRVDIEVIERALEEVPPALASVDSTALPLHPIHGDYHEENLLLEPSGEPAGVAGIEAVEVAAIIDWDECRLDWRMWDIANALWSLCRTEANTGLVPSEAARFLGAYESTGLIVLPEERMLIALCTRATRLFEALWGLGEMQRGHAGWDYVQQNIIAIDGIEELGVG